MCKKFEFEHSNKWYMHNPASVLEKDTHKLLWDFDIHTDHLISARRVDFIIIIKKNRICKIVDFAVWPQNKTERIWKGPKRPMLGFRRSATTLYPSLTAPLLPQSEPAGLLRLVIRLEHHQHDLPQHQSQPDRYHPLSIRRAPVGACGKGILPVSDPYRGGDWGWRRLHWIDISSTP